MRQKPRLIRIQSPRLGAIGIPYRDKSAIFIALNELYFSNLVYLHKFPQLFALIVKGLRYVNEPYSVEDFRNALQLYEALEGDCEDIASLYAARLTLTTGDVWLPHLVEYPSTYHIVTRRVRDGAVRDYCYKHGMRRV